MNCKNCKTELNPKDKFCNNCGAKIINDRITVKRLFSDVFDALGWGSNFFVTLRHLIFKPQVVFKEYINGTRKKYANPFTFYTISLAISLFVFSLSSEQLMQISTNSSMEQTVVQENTASNDFKDVEMFGFKNQEEFSKAIMEFQMKYYNLMGFLLLPLCTLIAFFVFRKPYNFGEHLIINTYLQTIITFSEVILFIFSLLIGFNIFFAGGLIFMFFYYLYAYKKLYDFTFGKLLLKTLKFIGISLLIFLALVITGAIIAIFKDKILT